MKITLTGATGFIGKKLVRRLLANGHAVTILTRNPARAQNALSDMPCSFFSWDAEREEPNPKALEGADAIIHLAGEPVAEKRWTKIQKEKIRSSRIKPTENLIAALKKLPKNHHPKTLISASAIGFYGNRHNEISSESSEAGHDFLAQVCKDWEQSASQLPSIRTVIIRIGIVLGDDGGALLKMLPIFRKGLGGPLGSGLQWMSWIHVDDLIALILEALQNEKYDGPINATAPVPVRNKEFTQILAKALARPAFFTAPAPILKLALGEMSDILLGGQRVLPSRALKNNFQFQFKDLSTALKSLNLK